MRYNASILIVLFILTNIAFGAIGDVGVSDGPKIIQSAVVQTSAYQANPLNSQQNNGYQQSQQSTASSGLNYGSNNNEANYGSNAPQTAGPYQERLSADDLKFMQPKAESFQPDSSLNFISASPPSGVYTETSSPDQGQGNWYYPGSVTSRNMFYAQTSSGLKTTAGCAYGGYLPLWADLNSAGNFYVYEWYPGQWTPSVRWWGWKWPGFQKGWFTGDLPGWHILSYNCRDWSNYIYIYVWPNGGSSYVASPNVAGTFGPSTSPVPMNQVSMSQTSMNQASLPSGSPTPPDPNSENLVLPDFNLLQPATGGYAQSPGQTGYVQAVDVPQTNANYPVQSTYPAQSAYPLSGTNSFQGASPVPTSTMPSGYSGCTGCSDKNGYTGSYGAYVASPGYPSQGYQAVYPKPTAYRCNQYYVQIYPGKISTVAGVKCGQWLPLLSKIGSSGIYWSFEWSQCGSPQGYYCYPEVKSFGFKGMGWYQTWFMGNRPGWHILSYYDNDWSNYVYIYVWPA